MKKMINLWDYAGKLLEQTGKGVLLTTQVDGKVNTMTIGWGTLGIEWGKTIYTVFVRESRYTKELLEKNPFFTINVPMDDSAKEILKVCGTKSGRDMDKIQALNLELEDGETINVPGIKQLPLTLECKVIYKQEQDPEAIAPESIQRYYPVSPATGKGDYHTAYYGQVTAAYILE